MPILTEPIGSIPRPADLVAAWGDLQTCRIDKARFDEIAEAALVDTIRRFERTGSPIITDGEQTKYELRHVSARRRPVWRQTAWSCRLPMAIRDSCRG